MDVYKLWEDLKVNVPVFLTTLPTAIQSTSRRTTIRITYNPKTSTTKQFDFNFRLGKNFYLLFHTNSYLFRH